MGIFLQVKIIKKAPEIFEDFYMEAQKKSALKRIIVLQVPCTHQFYSITHGRKKMLEKNQNYTLTRAVKRSTYDLGKQKTSKIRRVYAITDILCL